MAQEKIEKRAVCSIASVNYFAQIRNMVKSVKSTNVGIEVYVLLTDSFKFSYDFSEYAKGDGFHLLSIYDLEVDKAEAYMYKYDVVGFNSMFKPWILKYLLEKGGYSKVLYIDPDMMVFHQLNLAYDYLDRYSIILTPHMISDNGSNIEEVNNCLKFGVYNLGFIGVSDTEEGIGFLKWWGDKLKRYCYLDYGEGMAWDQKWIDLVPALFNEVFVLKDMGYNVAFWNLFERLLSGTQGNIMVNGQYPLVIYHFSHYKLYAKEYLTYYEENNYIDFPENVCLKEMYNAYYSGVMDSGYNEYSKISYYKTDCFN